MRDRTIAIAFFGFIVLTGVLLSGSIFAVIAVVVALLVIGIVVALKPRQPVPKPQSAGGEISVGTGVSVHIQPSVRVIGTASNPLL